LYGNNRQKDEVAGEVPVAFVVRSNDLDLNEEAVKDYIAKQVLVQLQYILALSMLKKIPFLNNPSKGFNAY
jgi:acyl-CoA synthetase (AMP-forming)/AMP-acid ligase II